MKTIDFTPKICKGKNPPCTGTVKLRVPTYDEKLELMELLNVNFDDQGNISYGDGNNRKTMASMIKFSYKYYQEVDITIKATGEKFTSLEDLQTDDYGDKIIQEIGTAVIHRFRVGKR